jgi:hypothetical protein
MWSRPSEPEKIDPTMAGTAAEVGEALALAVSLLNDKIARNVVNSHPEAAVRLAALLLERKDRAAASTER